MKVSKDNRNTRDFFSEVARKWRHVVRDILVAPLPSVLFLLNVSYILDPERDRRVPSVQKHVPELDAL